MRLFAFLQFSRRSRWIGAPVGTKLMTVKRWLACALAAAVFGATAGQTAELPAQNKKPTKAEAAKACDIAGNPGVLAANGICVRLSGYISSQFSAGQAKEQLK
jgi:predicted MFS family arabinose efflux permease